MADNQRGDTYLLTRLDIEDLNEIFKRMGERMDAIEGLRGEVTTQDKIKTASGVKVVDDNGIVIHGFADTTD